jgi:hypothetical protein
MPPGSPNWLGAFEKVVEQTSAHEHERLQALFRIASLWSTPTRFLIGTGYAKQFPEPAIECSADSFESLALAIHGYYKSAVTVLRRQVELSLTSCLFRYCPDHHTTDCPEHKHRYARSERTPPWHQLAEVFDLHQFMEYSHAMNQRGREDLSADVQERPVHSFYTTLSKAVHSAPGTWNILDWDFKPFPTYSAEAFDAWADLFEAVQRISLLWLLLAHPGMFRWIEDSSPQEWSIALDYDEVEFLTQSALARHHQNPTPLPNS